MRRIALLCLLAASLDAQAIRRLPGFQRNSIPRNDDGSSALVNLPFTINFFGRIRSSAYVNNNGNITFDASLATYTPFGLTGTQREIIAAFFADVDTRGDGSQLVYYGEDNIDGKKAFGVNYFNVGYFASHFDRLNTFQLILIDRSDTGTGNFDVEFNYEKIQWETGDASGGTGGLGGVPASVGWSNGSGLPGTSYELPGSLIVGQFLDNGPRALARRRINSPLIGRYVYRARGGLLSPGLEITSSAILPKGVIGIPYLANFTAGGGTNPYRWSLTPDPGAALPGLSLNQQGVFSGTPTARGTYEFTVSVTSRIDNVEETVSQRVTLQIDAPSLTIDSRACPLPDGAIGSAYSATLRATGGGGPLLWSWGENNVSPVPGLTLSEGGVISGLPTRAGSYNFLIRVAGPPSQEAQPGFRPCTLNIRQQTTTPTILACPDAAGTVGVPYDSTLTATGGSAPWRWALNGPLPLGVGLSSQGRLSGIPTQTGSYPFEIVATDTSGRTVAANCTLTVGGAELNITTACPLPSAVTGEPYSAPLAAEGGTGPYIWTVSGTLPNGVTLRSDGQIAGSANEAGIWRFLLIARDRNGLTGAVPCTFIVARSPLSISSCPLPEARHGRSYTARLTTVGGTAPLQWTNDTPLPEGLTILSAGLIAGTPTVAGNAEFRLRVSDAVGNTTSQLCRLFIRPDQLQILRDCPLTATVGIYFREHALAQGGVTPYRWRAEGALPEGVTLGADGWFSGTPKAPGRFPFSLILEDARKAETRQSCELLSNVPSVPDLRISVTSGVTANVPIDLNLSRAYPLPISGELVLTSEANTGAADAEVNHADPAVQLLPAGRRVRFEIPAGARTLRLRLASTGTVASRHLLRIERLTIAGQPQLVTPPAAAIEVPRTAPVVSDACYTIAPGGYLNIRLVGQSSTRELTALTLDLNGKTLSDTPVAPVAFDYFSSPLNIRSGGAFQMEVPVQVEKEGFDVQVASLSIRLANRAGTSASREARRCN